MGLIRVDLFSTLDGVAQAPGGPEEDPEGGFRFGGWQAPLTDEQLGEWVGDNLRDLDALLLGRRTYDIFADYWPLQTEGPDTGIATLFNRVPKYVVSRNRDLERLEEELSDALAATVRLQVDARGRGRVVIQVSGLDQLDGVVARLKG